MTIDLLRWPVIGPFLGWRHARTTMQFVLLVVAVLIVLHGLLGPQFAPSNLATVVTWVHYRGLLVVALLAAGNLFCAGCPFVLARDTARKMTGAPTRRWPRILRSKWIAMLLFAGVLFAYELFDLWALPSVTAYLILGYFAAAMLVDTLFTGATFCKYLCPIGQFNFVASTLSPLEVRVRSHDVCRSCRTFDCIKGAPATLIPAQRFQRGCELRLFQPLKVGNLDCTFCLDCVQACPHDNVTIGSRVPGFELLDERRRSGIGRIQDRWDVAALALLFVAGAMLNAFGMVGPFRAVEQVIANAIGSASEPIVLGVVFLIGLVLVPAAGLAVPAWMGRGAAARRYALTLIPFGFGIWLAHYAFHFLTGVLTIVPVTQSAVIDAFGWPALGEPMWRWVGFRAGAVFPVQLGLILLGGFGSLALSKRSLGGIAVLIALCAMAMWLVAQPMDMRGIALGG